MTLTCSLPPEPDDARLLAFLDGQPDEPIAAHLRDCSYCRGRAQRLERMEVVLRSLLYRMSCPSPLELGEYHLGVLAGKQARAIGRHLAECPHCAREVAQLESFLGDLAPVHAPSLAEQIVEQIDVLVARLAGGVSGLLPTPQLAPVLAGVRGGGSGPVIYEAGGARVYMTSQPAAAGADGRDLLGLLSGVDPAGFSAYLWQDGRLVAAALVDAGGNFVVHGLAPAPYELVLSGPGQEIYIERLEV